MKPKEHYLEFLEPLTDELLPEFIQEADDEQLAAVAQYVGQILQKERAGLDGLFESMSQTMKYIPNFLLQAITQKYIEPPVAARITAKLPMKNSVAIASGLPGEYIGEVAAYMDSQIAAELLGCLPKKKIIQISAYLLAHHAMKALDIAPYIEERTLKLFSPNPEFLHQQEEGLSEHRIRALRLFQEL